MARQVIALALVLVAAAFAAVVSAQSPHGAPTASPRAQPVASPISESPASGISSSPVAGAPEEESSYDYAPEAYAPVADGPGYAPVSGPAADIAPAPHNGAAALEASAAIGFAAAAGFMLL